MNDIPLNIAKHATEKHQEVAPQPPLPLGKHDPILQELWAVKAAINKGAAYQISTLVERARALDSQALFKRFELAYKP